MPLKVSVLTAKKSLYTYSPPGKFLILCYGN